MNVEPGKLCDRAYSQLARESSFTSGGELIDLWTVI